MASLRQLEYLVAVVDAGSFTRAAERLHVTQPGLSHQFLALERDVGGPLLERLPRGVRLTPAGRAMLPYARLTLAEANRATAAARRATGLAGGELQVATLHSISTGLLPAAIATWHERHPELPIRIFEHPHSDRMAAAMAVGQADIAIGPLPPDWPGPSQFLGIEEFVIVTAAGDSAASTKRRSVPMSRLADRGWVHFTPDTGLADILDAACAAEGFSPHVALRTDQASSAVNYAAAGVGPTLVPQNIIPPHFTGALLRPRPPIQRPLTAYTRTRPDPIASAFADLLAEQPLLTPPQ